MPRALSIAACATALAAMAVAPSWAAAAAGSVTDDSLADFQAGTTVTATQVVAPGSVQLAPISIPEEFDGSALPTPPWSWTPWTTGGDATVANGQLSVNGALVADDAYAPAPRTLEFRARFSAARFEHIGYGTDFNSPPWAMLSTGGGTASNGLPLPVGFYARTAAPGASTAIDTAIPDVDPTVPHTYRIEWRADQVRYYVDGTLVATQTAAIAVDLRPLVSDLDADGSAVTVDWMDPDRRYTATGTFRSRVLGAGDARAAWGVLTAQTGGDVTFETRSGNTPTPDASWSSFQPVGPAGAIQSPMGRYLQYQAGLQTADPTLTPSLDRVDASFNVDDVAPVVTIDGVAVAGSTATVRFSSADADVARYECSLDGGAFAACTSPAAYAQLRDGTHTVAVWAVDRVGNVGAASSRAFTVHTARPDKTAPAIHLKQRAVRVSRSGVVKLTIACPRSEARCAVTVRLKRGRLLVAHKSANIAGGKSRVLSVRLTHAMRRKLAHARRLKVTATVTARDAAGNTKTTKKTITLLAPKR